MFNRDLAIELAMDYTDEDIEFLKQQRKYWIRIRENNSEKTIKKYALKYEKSITLVIDYLNAKHCFHNPPIELMWFIKTAFAFISDSSRHEFIDVYGKP